MLHTSKSLPCLPRGHSSTVSPFRPAVGSFWAAHQQRHLGVDRKLPPRYESTMPKTFDAAELGGFSLSPRLGD